MAGVGWRLGEDEGQWTFPGFLGFLHFWIRRYDTVMEGRFTPRVGGKQSPGGRQIQCEKKAMGSDDWGQACPCPTGTAPAQTCHVQTWAYGAIPHFKRNWKSECCATFPGYWEVAWKTKYPLLVGFAQWCSALAQHIFLPLCVTNS